MASASGLMPAYPAPRRRERKPNINSRPQIRSLGATIEIIEVRYRKNRLFLRA